MHKTTTSESSTSSSAFLVAIISTLGWSQASYSKSSPEVSKLLSVLFLPTTQHHLGANFTEFDMISSDAECSYLGMDDPTKTDEFLEKFQTAFDPPPPHFRKIMLRFFSGIHDLRSVYNGKNLQHKFLDWK